MQNTCPYCSTTLDQDIVFCPFCGKSVSLTSDANRSTSPIARAVKHAFDNNSGSKIEPTCPTCGDVLDPNSDSCYRCLPNPEYIPLPPMPASEIIGRQISFAGVVLLIIGILTILFLTSPYPGIIVMATGSIVMITGFMVMIIGRLITKDKHRPVQTVYRKASVPEIIGMLISLAGVVLIIGNLTGFFPTFSFAGFIVMIIGGLITNAGSR